MPDDRINRKRRRLLIGLTTVAGGIGAAYVAVPFIRSMQPSAKTQAAGAPLKVDLGTLKPGQLMTTEWRGKPIWVLRRTPAMLETLEDPGLIASLRDPDSKNESQQPAYARNSVRSVKQEFYVCIALCTHLGCIPSFRPEPGAHDVGSDWQGGFFCPCHGSRFDLAGRVFKHVPAPTNLVIPPHRFIDEHTLEIGVHTMEV